jgi:hypothetical protein
MPSPYTDTPSDDEGTSEIMAKPKGNSSRADLLLEKCMCDDGRCPWTMHLLELLVIVVGIVFLEVKSDSLSECCWGLSWGFSSFWYEFVYIIPLLHMLSMCVSFGWSKQWSKQWCCKTGVYDYVVLSLTTFLTCITVILLLVDVAGDTDIIYGTSFETKFCVWREIGDGECIPGEDTTDSTRWTCPDAWDLDTNYFSLDWSCDGIDDQATCESTVAQGSTAGRTPDVTAMCATIAWICALLAAIPFRIRARLKLARKLNLEKANKANAGTNDCQTRNNGDNAYQRMLDFDTEVGVAPSVGEMNEHRLSHATDAEFRAAIDCAIEKEDYETAAKLKREQSALAKVTDALHAALAARDYETAGKMQRRKAAMLPTK